MTSTSITVRLLTRLILILACLTPAWVGAAYMLASPAAATVTASSSHTSLWWDSDTCRAFAAWEHKHTPLRLSSLVRDSGHADTYLRTDVGGLYELVRHQAPVTVIARWEGFVRQDCDPRSSYGL